MFDPTTVVSGFSVDDSAAAKEFYGTSAGVCRSRKYPT